MEERKNAVHKILLGLRNMARHEATPKNEALVAEKMFQEMLKKHGLKESDLQDREQVFVPIASWEKKVPEAAMFVGSYVQARTGCALFVRDKSKIKCLELYGEEHAAKRGKKLFLKAYVEFNKALAYAKKHYEINTERERMSYFFGLSEGMKGRMPNTNDGYCVVPTGREIERGSSSTFVLDHVAYRLGVRHSSIIMLDDENGIGTTDGKGNPRIGASAGKDAR